MTTISLPPDQRAKLGRHLRGAGRREIGGILMGEQLEHDRFRITQRVYGHLFEKGRRDTRAIIAGEQSVLGEFAPATPMQHAELGRMKSLDPPKP